MEEVSDAELISAYKTCFASSSGRIVLRHLIKAHGVFRTNFSEDGPHSTAFNEGGRNAVLQIMRKLHKKQENLDEKLIEQGEEYEYSHDEIL